jgi:L-alanine-DL-glutamate epimerase-like enolase superfamily enzyme
VTLYDRIAGLPLEVDQVRLAWREREVSSGFLRRTTVVSFHGGGETGIGEDVDYVATEHLPEGDAGLPLTGSLTFDELSGRLDGLDLFPAGDPEYPASRDYRRWAFESAALDLALRQAETTLAAAVGRQPQPVRFVVSMRLGEPASTAPLRDWLDLYPELRFKLDPTASWDDALVAELAATGAVDSVDLKGAYRGTVVDQPPDPALYRRVAEGFPHAWIEDPNLTPETLSALDGARERVTWDAIIHSVEDVLDLPWQPRMLNIKPSRFGTISRLFACYEHCEREGIGMYGGGQFELGPGRGQIQYLASLFHPDTPNDVAPGAYNDPEARPGLPPSPLPVAAAERGFRWGDE